MSKSNKPFLTKRIIDETFFILDVEFADEKKVVKLPFDLGEFYIIDSSDFSASPTCSKCGKSISKEKGTAVLVAFKEKSYYCNKCGFKIFEELRSGVNNIIKELVPNSVRFINDR